ncbi:MAG: hypothetical protein J5441_07890 [Clostridia bacterium]|nr:hypothetical protein [Clostridia bacterium]
MSASITSSRRSALRFDVGVPFLLSLGALMFVSGGLAVWAALAALTHEAAHLLAIYACGFRVRRVSLHGGGVRMELNSEPPKGKAALILASGCFGNLLAAGAVKAFGGASLRAYIFFGANLLLCLLNILPHSSLDGGKLLRLALGERGSAAKVAFCADVAVTFLLTAAGAMIFLKCGKNPTALLLGLCLVAKLPVFGKKSY